MDKDNLVRTDLLKAERKRRNLTYKQMAGKLGYKSQSTYMYIEKGRTVPSLPVMLKISRILNKPVDYFFSFESKDIE